MKKLLLATSALVMTAGFASAEVTLSGDARMGLIGEDGGDVHFSSRARVSFALSGESDSGFTFGASFGAQDASGAAAGDADAAEVSSSAGSVFVSGAFGTLTMGDTDNAAQATVGQVDGAGYAGVGSHNEITYLGDETTSVRYDFAAGGLSFSASSGQMNVDDNSTSVAAAYAVDGYKVSIGYENHYTEIDDTNDDDTYAIEDHIVVGADATFDALTVKARYGFADAREDWAYGSEGITGSFSQYALSATYTVEALAVTAFVANSKLEDGDGDWVHTDRFGLGASYDLGGGAALKAGYSSAKLEEHDQDAETESEWDMGLTFSF